MKIWTGGIVLAALACASTASGQIYYDPYDPNGPRIIQGPRYGAPPAIYGAPPIIYGPPPVYGEPMTPWPPPEHGGPPIIYLDPPEYEEYDQRPEQPPMAAPDPAPAQPEAPRAAEAPPPISMAAVNAAEFEEGLAGPQARPMIMKLQVLLDRRRLSPGVIDGFNGDNVRKALRLLQALEALPVTGVLDRATWDVLAADSEPVLTRYVLSDDDVAGPFLNAVPQDFGAMARLEHLGYTSPLEKLAEKFHIDERTLQSLNPGVDFAVAGAEIVAPALGRPAELKVARIVADKRVGQVRVYDAEDQLVAAYPATIGSEDTPSPSGTHTVTAIAFDPAYYYDPQRNFQQGDNTEKLTLPPGPNNPVGSVWISLSKPSYGIHGTPEPSKIGKTASRGCVRLTNWDAQELAGLVSEGVTVTFLDPTS